MSLLALNLNPHGNRRDSSPFLYFPDGRLASPTFGALLLVGSDGGLRCAPGTAGPQLRRRELQGRRDLALALRLDLLER